MVIGRELVEKVAGGLRRSFLTLVGAALVGGG